MTEAEFKNHLQRFAPLLPDVLHAMVHLDKHVDGGTSLRTRFAKSEGVDAFVGLLLKTYAAPGATKFMEQSVEDVVARDQRDGWQFQTTQDFDTQHQMALWTWRELTKPGRQALLKTFCRYAFFDELTGFAMARLDESAADAQVSSRIFQYMLAICESGHSKVDVIFREMATTHLPAGFNVLADGTQDSEPSTYFTRIFGNTTINLFRLLLGLPYAELIGNTDLSWLPSMPHWYVPATDQARTESKAVIPRAPEATRNQVAAGTLEFAGPKGKILAAKIIMPMHVRSGSGSLRPTLLAWLDVDTDMILAFLLTESAGANLRPHEIAFSEEVDQATQRFISNTLGELAAMPPVELMELRHPGLQRLAHGMMEQFSQPSHERFDLDHSQGRAAIPLDPIPSIPNRPFPLRMSGTPRLGTLLRQLVESCIEEGLSADTPSFLGPLGVPPPGTQLGAPYAETARVQQRTVDVENYLAYKIAGAQVFQFPEQLGQALIESDAADIPFSELRMPHTGFYLHPGCIMRVDCQVETGRQVQIGIEGFFIREGTSHTGKPAYLITPVLDATTRAKNLFAANVIMPFGGGTVSQQIAQGAAEATASIDAQRASIKAMRDADPMTAKVQRDYGIDIDEMMRQTNDHTIQFAGEAGIQISSAVASMICYVTAYRDHGKDVFLGANPDSAKRYASQTEKKKKVMEQHWEASGIAKVKLFADPFAGAQHARSGDGTVEPHMRRGHFRMQPHGPQSSLRKLIWLHPVLVNAEHAAHTRDRVYEVQPAAPAAAN